MIPNILLLIFATAASSFLWWRSRFKICRRCRHALDGGHLFAISVGRSNRMAKKVLDNTPSGPKLDALTAEKVFGWRNIHKRDGALVGKSQGNAGHLRRAKVPNYAGNPLHVYAIEDARIRYLGSNEATWAVGPIPGGTSQDHSRQRYSFGLGFAGPTLPGCHQSWGAVRPGV